MTFDSPLFCAIRRMGTRRPIIETVFRITVIEPRRLVRGNVRILDLRVIYFKLGRISIETLWLHFIVLLSQWFVLLFKFFKYLNKMFELYPGCFFLFWKNFPKRSTELGNFVTNHSYYDNITITFMNKTHYTC